MGLKGINIEQLTGKSTSLPKFHCCIDNDTSGQEIILTSTAYVNFEQRLNLFFFFNFKEDVGFNHEGLKAQDSNFEQKLNLFLSFLQSKRFKEEVGFNHEGKGS